jgi:RNA polymerase sigma-70 factor, ECF subfamily
VEAKNQKIDEFMRLYKPVGQRLSAYCRVVAKNEAMALDLIQETLLAAFENFDKLRDSEAFVFYLFGIARNCHSKQKRKNKFFGNQDDIKNSNIEIASDSIEMSLDIELIRKSIASLNDEQRDVILMFHIMGFSIKEIAENFSITEAAVKNRLLRGREKLRQLISDKESRTGNRISANN